MSRLRDLAHTAKMAGSLVKNPPWTSHGHFYSPLTTPADVDRALAAQPVTDLVDIHEAAQDALLECLAPMWTEFDPSRRRRWHMEPENTQYGLADAAVYNSMLRRCQPKRVVEVGSGFSSAVALDTRDEHDLPIELTFIEPYTKRLDKLLTQEDRSTATIRREFVQQTPADVFADLEAGDFLFIDSTHVLKAGSDVEHLLFRVLPKLPVGVLVHVHDCFWPWQYPEVWLRQRRDWNELYYLHAFLAGNPEWEIVLFSDWAWQERRELVQTHLTGAENQRPGNLWLRRVTESRRTQNQVGAGAASEPGSAG